MTNEEAIANLERMITLFYEASIQNKMMDYSEILNTLEFVATALRSVSRERVEKVCRGEWIHDINNRYGCSKCMARETMSYKNLKPYRPNCGAPMADEAVQMVMERLEALKDGKDCSI